MGSQDLVNMIRELGTGKLPAMTLEELARFKVQQLESEKVIRKWQSDYGDALEGLAEKADEYIIELNRTVDSDDNAYRERLLLCELEEAVEKYRALKRPIISSLSIEKEKIP